jgi:hypothetical protein
MKPIPLVYMVQSEKGLHTGYVMPLEIAKLIINRKPPPDEREVTVQKFSPAIPLLRSEHIKTSHRGV